MAGSGSDKRQRQIILKARFTDAEASLIREQAERAGVSVAAIIRHAVLGQAPLRASRRPTVNYEAAARFLGRLGQIAAALRGQENGQARDQRIEAAQRDLSEMRTTLFEVLEREP